MLEKRLHTTPLLRASEKEELVEIPVGKPRLGRIFWIGGQLSLLLLGFARARIAGDADPRARAAKVREFLENLGGMWIKLGQVLSMRTDLFSREFCTELGRLVDRAMTFPSSISVEIIEEELGLPVAEVFDEFEPRPFAAASLSQVHRARLKDDGARVVIKVQRPYVSDHFRYDFRWLSATAAFLGRFRRFRQYRMDEMLGELQEMMAEEVDYRQEASNINKLKDLLAAHEVYVPEVYVDLSTGRVLVMECLEGVFMSDFNSVMKEDPERAQAWLEENEIDTSLVARGLFQSSMRQMFEDLKFHGDLHYGNIILLRESRFALIDFGNVGRLDPRFAAIYDRYFAAVSAGSFERATDLMLVLMGQLPVVNMAKLRARIIKVLEKQAVRSSIKNLPYHEKSIGRGSAEMGEVMSEFGVGVNWQYLKMARAFETVDQNIALLNPQFDFVDEMTMYLEAKAKRQSCERVDRVAGFIPRFIDWFDLASSELTRTQLRFEGEISIVSRLVAGSLRRLAFVATGFLVLVTWVYLYQHHQAVVAGFHDSEHWFTRLVESIPSLHQYAWYLLGAIVAVSIFRMRRFAKSLMKPPARLPGD